MPEECMKNNKDFPYGRCCCNCRWHIGDYSHPMTDGKDVLNRRGWICFAPELKGAFSDWPEHSLCEMWSEGKSSDNLTEAERLMTFGELKEAILKYDAKSEYQQVAIVMLRTIFDNIDGE